jgi:hypothetical protein
MKRDSPRQRTRDRVQQLATAAAVAGSVACSSKGGSQYGVVDMLPSPAQCADGSTAIQILARAESLANGDVAIAVSVLSPNFDAALDVISGGTLVKAPVGGTGFVSIELRPDAPDAGVAAQVRLSLVVTCNGVRHPFVAAFDSSILPADLHFAVDPMATSKDGGL